MCCRFVKSSARRKKCFRCQSIWWIGFCRQFRRGRHDYNCSAASVFSLRPNCWTRFLWQLTNWWCTPTSPSAPTISWYAFEFIHCHQLSVIVPHILTSLVSLLPVQCTLNKQQRHDVCVTYCCLSCHMYRMSIGELNTTQLRTHWKLSPLLFLVFLVDILRCLLLCV